MDDMGEEAALPPPLHAEWEHTDSDEEFPLLAQIDANPFGHDSKAAVKAAAGDSMHADSLVAEGETTATDPAVETSVGESSQKLFRGRGGRHLVRGTKGKATRYQLPFCRWRHWPTFRNLIWNYGVSMPYLHICQKRSGGSGASTLRAMCL
jgi:hypothetical protein